MIKLVLLIILTSACAHQTNQDLKVTFVTGLWNVARGDMIIFKRSFDYYLNYLRDVLHIKDNIIMFGDAELKKFVESNRQYQDNIHFIQKDLSDIAKYWYTDKIGKVIDKTKEDWLKWQKYSILPQFGLRMYNPVVMSKLRFVAEASLVDPFNSDYYIWIDGGLTHSFDKSILTQGTFVKFSRHFQLDWLIQTGKGLPYRPFEIGFKNEGRDYANITTKQRYYVWGNWLGGKATAATTAYNTYENLLRVTLENGDMNTDQALLFLMMERYGFLFHRVVDPDTFGAHKAMMINSSIVDERYNLRDINASAVIAYSNLRDPQVQSCIDPPILDLYYDIEGNKYFQLAKDISTRTLKIRIALLLMFLGLGLVFRRMKEQRMNSFQRLTQYEIE